MKMINQILSIFCFEILIKRILKLYW